jgi:hypothetical protein
VFSTWVHLDEFDDAIGYLVSGFLDGRWQHIAVEHGPIRGVLVFDGQPWLVGAAAVYRIGNAEAHNAR